jgi:hypothetical protein
MRLVAILLAVIQFTFAFHAVRTGRGAKWVLIIVLAPVVGCLAYYFVEVFPSSREERQLRKHVRDIARALNPDGELKRRAEEASLTASVDNRAALAGECLEKGMFDEAIRLYEGCLEGPHANDPGLLFACARAHFYNGGARHAEEYLARLQQQHPRFRPEEAGLLRARVLEAQGDTAGALSVYAELRDRYVGFEAKYRYAMLLKGVGRSTEARELFDYISAHARRSALESEQQWVKLARAERETAGA